MFYLKARIYIVMPFNMQDNYRLQGFVSKANTNIGLSPVEGLGTTLLTYIDTHCHYHPSYEFSAFFKHVATNIQKHAVGSKSVSAICLLEMEGTDWFLSLEDSDSVDECVIETINPQTLKIIVDDHELYVFCARQVNTLEKIEVVVVGCREPIPSGLPLDQYIDKYAEDYLVILPWGVGKWLGNRGKLISELINNDSAFILGDNGGRPKIWSKVPQFDQANEQDLPILAGSDPLPVSSFSNRAASYGCIFQGEFTDCNEWIKAVKQMDSYKEPYGELSSIYQFLADQLGLRLKKFF